MSNGQAFLNAFYIGINIQNILYGVELVLYFRTMYILLRKRGVHKRHSLFYVLFSSMMLFLITVWVATEALFGQKIWLLDSGFPGGPYAYWGSHLSDWYLEWSRVAMSILQLMTDGLMIYRCRVIWNSYCITLVPIIVWFAALALGILVAWTNSLQGVGVHIGIAMEIGLSYWSVSVFLNTLVTSMICYRVLRYGRVVREHVGREYASIYFTVVATIIESVLPYTIASIVFLVTLGVGSPTYRTFMCVYFLMMCISPQMLILRVVAGKAWQNDTFSSPCSVIKFNPGTPAGSPAGDRTGTGPHVQASNV